ncbi:MAG: hypothetical protein JW902_09450 [Syntrophaceae bacterium]|nr:hypothetical protein [Syntrophaceae bacterium]
MALFTGIVTVPEDAVAVIPAFLKLLFRAVIYEQFSADGIATPMYRLTLLAAGSLLFRREIGHIWHLGLRTTYYDY